MSITGLLADPSRLARLRIRVEPPTAGGELAWTLPPGDEGVYETLAAMEAVARDAAQRSTCRAIAGVGYELTMRSWTPVRLWTWLRDHVQFERDPARLEWLQHPERFGVRALNAKYMGKAKGDCDDRALLGAGIALALGWPVSWKVIGAHAGGPFQHVYFVVHGERDDDGYFAVDPQETKVPGDEAPHARAHLHRIAPVEVRS